MSNKRKLKPTRKVPPHEHSGEERVIHFCDADTCPGEGCSNVKDDIHLCERGYDDALALVQAEAAITCPVCGCDEHGYVRMGRQWLGEPRLLPHCCHGCDEAAMRAALIAQEFDPGKVFMSAVCPNCHPEVITAGMLAAKHGEPEEPSALYRWWDTEDLLLYIGISDELAARVKGHVKASSWMDFAARSAIERHPSRAAAVLAEEAAIKAEKPLFNHQHNSSPEAQKRLVEYLIKHNRLDLLAPAVSRG